MYAQLVQGWEHLVTHMAPVHHVLLMAASVLQKRLQLPERLPTGRHDTLVHLAARKRDSNGHTWMLFPVSVLLNNMNQSILLNC